MEQPTYIPEQKEGKALDIEETITASGEAEAREIFNRAKNRLLHPGEWQKISGSLTAEFKLAAQESPDAIARVNDHIRIDIPGPGSVTGEGYDWVRIDDIQTDPEKAADESFLITLRPSDNPEKLSEDTAHFFQSNATSSFLLLRKGATVSARYHGRNEIANTEDVPVTDKVRNALVAGAAKAGISEIQWKSLVSGLLK